MSAFSRKALWLSALVFLSIAVLWSLPASPVMEYSESAPSDDDFENVDVTPIPDDDPMMDDGYDEPFVKSDAPFDSVLLPAPPPGAALDAVDYAIGRLPMGGVAFNVPGDLELGEWVDVELVVSATATGAVLRDMVRAEGAMIDTVAPVGRDLRADLVSASGGLAVESTIRDQSRTLGRTREARWRWRVTAREGGRHDLNLALYTTVTLGDERREIDVQTFHREISVYVSPTQRVAAFVGEHWQWLLTFIVVPVAGFGWRTWRQPQLPEHAREPGGGRRRNRRRRS